jgi:hypothetical protein
MDKKEKKIFAHYVLTAALDKRSRKAFKASGMLNYSDFQRRMREDWLSQHGH